MACPNDPSCSPDCRRPEHESQRKASVCRSCRRYGCPATTPAVAGLTPPPCKGRTAPRWLVALAMVLVACGSDPPKTGMVLDKKFAPAWTEHGSTLTCMGYGQYGCTMWMPLPWTTNHPNRWHLFLENCDKAKKNGEPQCFKGYREVSSGTYEQTGVGEHFAGETGR